MGMTNRVHVYAGAVAAASFLLLTGCNSSDAPLVTRAGTAAGASETIPARLSNMSGDYLGTIQDAQGGTGNAKGTLAQHGGNAGGGIKDKETNKTFTVEFSITVNSSNSTTGAMVVDYPPLQTGPVCTFSTTGAYDPTTNTLSGSYTAVTGCTGDTGTYTLTQQCHDTVITSSSMPRRENNPHC
jgi:hypothetical protein